MVSAGDHPALGVPKQALIYEGDQVRVWVAHEDKSIELRQIKTGLSNGMISQREHDEADKAPIVAFPIEDIFRETAPYVTEHIRRDLVARYGNDRLLDEGLKVYATVDLEREHDAVAATIKGVIEADKRQGFRGPLMQLKKKDWDDFSKKEQAFLEGDGKRDEVIAALVTSVEKESVKVRIGAV